MPGGFGTVSVGVGGGKFAAAGKAQTKLMGGWAKAKGLLNRSVDMFKSALRQANRRIAMGR